MNPFELKAEDIDSQFFDIKKMYPKAYDKNKVSPWTKVRVILMNGTEFESNWFLHQFARNCSNNDLRREIARVRKQEQMQQKRISCLKPINETFLETTISYEQLAIDLTATLARNEKDKYNIKALNFALLEDFDHLYRFANLLKMDQNIDADMLVGKFTEIMPGRPTISEHRFPFDDVRRPMNSKEADPYSKCVASIITAAEQQTMNFYMNVANLYKNDLGRKLFAEIAMIEEQHVTQYESLKDPNLTWLEMWLMHEYVECYLYYSMMKDESDDYIRSIWEEHFNMEVSHLNIAAKMLKKYEKKDVSKVIPDGKFPKLISFGNNKEYIRKVLKTVGLTSKLEDYVEVSKLPKDDKFFWYQEKVHPVVKDVPSHMVIEKAIKKFGRDYRFQESPHPIPSLDDTMHDNTTAGRV